MAKPDSISSLDAHAGYWVRWVSNHVSHAFRLKIEAHGVTAAEWVLLRQLFDSGETHPSQLAESLGMTRGAISKLITRLLDKGLVTREESANDRRYQDIELTRAAVNLVPKLTKLADDNDEEFFGVLTKSERKNLMDILKKLAELHQLTRMPVE